MNRPDVPIGKTIETSEEGVFYDVCCVLAMHSFSRDDAMADDHKVAHWAFNLADAMLAERRKRRS